MAQTTAAQTLDLTDDVLLAELAGLAGQLAREGHLDQPDASARASDAFTGSEIEVDIVLEDGRVKDYAQRMTGCPIGRATASLVGRHVIGVSADEVTEAAAQVDALLKGDHYAFAERWESLGLLEGTRHLRQRHGAVRLVFRAVGQALATAGAVD